MSLADVVAAIMLFALVAYALLAGADFGGGVWDLLATGPRKARQRETIAHAIGPIWEANHVWLILAVVLLFGAFPAAFALVMVRLHVPVTLMLIGIVLRGSSFVFRTYDSSRDAVQRRWGRVFAVSSLATPVLLGIVVGTLSTLALAEPGRTVWQRFFAPWLAPFPVAVGLFALAQFAFLAATYLTVDATEPELRDDFRRRALLSAIAVGVLALAVALLHNAVAPRIARELLGRWWSWPLQIVTGLAAVGAIVALWKRRFLAARTLAATQVALILLGWGMMMYPYLVAGALTIGEAASPPATLRLLLVGLAAGAIILFPALYYLLRTFKGGLIFGAVPEPEAPGAPSPRIGSEGPG